MSASRREAELFTDIQAVSSPQGFSSRAAVLDILQRRSVDFEGLPTGGADGRVHREMLHAWLFQTAPGSPACFDRALQVRASLLLASQQETQSSPEDRLKAAWLTDEARQQGLKDSQGNSNDDDTAVWQCILIAVGASPPSAVRAAKHLLAVAAAGLDANQVAFPHSAVRSGFPKPAPPLTPFSDLIKRDANDLVFPAGWLRGGDPGLVQPRGEAEEEAMKMWVRGRAQKHESLRSAVHGSPTALDMELTPWPMEPWGVLECCSERAEQELPQRVLAWGFEIERLRDDPSFIREGRYLRGTSHSDPAAMDTELDPWPTAELDVIKGDLPTAAQQELLAARAKRGGLSPAQMQQRRAALTKHFKQDTAAAEDPNFYEEVRPQLGKTASLAAMRARWASDEASTAELRERLADQGSELTAWPAPGSRRWPGPDAKWMKFSRWFAMWRKSQQTAQVAAASLSKPGMKRSVSGSSDASWDVVSECSHSSWQEVEELEDDSVVDMAPEERAGWVESAEKEIAELREDCEKEFVEAMGLSSVQEMKLSGCLDSLRKCDIDEMKALSKPPVGVAVTAEALAVCFQVRPKKVGGALDYWVAAKAALLAQPDLLDRMLNYDKDNIPPQVLNKLKAYYMRSDFRPEVVKLASVAAAGICHWVRGIYLHGEWARFSSPRWARMRALERKLSNFRASEASGCKLAAAEEKDPVSAACCLDRGMVKELGCFAKPPSECVAVSAACMHLLRNTERRMDWQAARKMMANPSAFIAELKALDVMAVSEASVRQAELLVAKPWFSFEGLKRKSLASAHQAEWVIRCVARRRLYERLTQDPEAARRHLAVVEKRAADAISGLDKQSIAELRSLTNPPYHVAAACAACAHLMRKTRRKGVDWGSAQKMLANPASFLEEVTAFDVRATSRASLREAEAFVSEPWFNFECMQAKSRCSAHLAEWVVQCVAKRRLLDVLEPRRAASDPRALPPSTAEAELSETTDQPSPFDVSAHAVHEMKSMTKPPASVAKAVEVVMHLLAGLDQRVPVDSEGAPLDVSWKAAGRLMRDPNALVQRLHEYPRLMDAGGVPEANFERALAVKDSCGEDLGPDSISKKSRAAACLCAWSSRVFEKYHTTTGKVPNTGGEPSTPLAGKISGDVILLSALEDTCSTQGGSDRGSLKSPAASSVSWRSLPPTPGAELSSEALVRTRELEVVLGSCVDKRDLTELKSMSAPPKDVVVVAALLAHLLAGPGADSLLEDEWRILRKFLGDPALLPRLLAFTVPASQGCIPAAAVARAAEVSSSLCDDRVHQSSKAAFGLLRWVRAAVEYHQLISQMG